MDKLQTGQCLCGSVTIEISGPMSDVVVCHCKQCRRQTGSLYHATNIARADVKLVGEISTYRASTKAERGFCAKCGSTLYWAHDEEDEIGIMAGSLDEPTGLGPVYKLDLEHGMSKIGLILGEKCRGYLHIYEAFRRHIKPIWPFPLRTLTIWCLNALRSLESQTTYIAIAPVQPPNCLAP